MTRHVWEASWKCRPAYETWRNWLFGYSVREKQSVTFCLQACTAALPEACRTALARHGPQTRPLTRGRSHHPACCVAGLQLQVTSPTHQKQGLCLPEPMLLHA
jgi:hypothetical protein